jgi:hypothetical protein
VSEPSKAVKLALGGERFETAAHPSRLVGDSENVLFWTLDCNGCVYARFHGKWYGRLVGAAGQLLQGSTGGMQATAREAKQPNPRKRARNMGNMVM